MQKAYHDMTDDEIKLAVRGIVRDSSSEDEITRRLHDELAYPYDVDIISYEPTDEDGRVVRAIVQCFGGLVRKDGAMVTIMMHGPRGSMISL